MAGFNDGLPCQTQCRELFWSDMGETDWAREGRHTGITDAPLNPVGEAAAKQLSERLAGGRYNWVWSSPRQRARRTAELAGFNGTWKSSRTSRNGITGGTRD